MPKENKFLAKAKHIAEDIQEKVHEELEKVHNKMENFSLPKITKVSKTEDNKIVVEVKEEGKAPVVFSATKTNNSGAKTQKPVVTQVKIVDQNEQSETIVNVSKKGFRLFRKNNKEGE